MSIFRLFLASVTAPHRRYETPAFGQRSSLLYDIVVREILFTTSRMESMMQSPKSYRRSPLLQDTTPPHDFCSLVHTGKLPGRVLLAFSHGFVIK